MYRTLSVGPQVARCVKVYSRSQTLSSLARTSLNMATRRSGSSALNSNVVRVSVRAYSSQTSAEKITSNEEKHEFKAETKKLLHLVANSLYSQREVFVRELISNASDALEKLRYLQTTSPEVQSEPNLEINIVTNSEEGTLTFQDTGIGMTEEEVKENLGTIARSGSKAFIEKLESQKSSGGVADSIVGQFGVGFYSSFMVGDKVKVFTKSSKPGSKGLCWESDGLGSYTLSEAENVEIGTKIIIHLKEDAKEFSKKETIEELVKKYSNFVGFNINIDGEKINTVEALWDKDRNSITEEEHKNFYKFIGGGWDDPQFRYVFKTDAPISIKSIFYVPGHNPEVLGYERIKSGISLYSRKVMIMAHADNILPEWLRFVKGVVESEDLPLNVSRELLQRGPVITKLKSVVTSKVIRWLQDEAKRDAEKYNEFFKNFGAYIKEGVCSDLENQKETSKLLRFESSGLKDGELTSLEEYIDRVGTEQEQIFYYCTPKRAFAEDSPYFEPFKANGKEVLFLHHPLDEFVMGRLGKYQDKKLVPIDSEDATKIVEDWNKGKGDSVEGKSLTDEQSTEISEWFRSVLDTKVKEVKVSSHLGSYPAVVTNFDSPAVRRMMKMMNNDSNAAIPLSPCTLELNSRDPVITGLAEIKGTNPELAKKVAEQVYDNALIAAGLVEDPRTMVKRLNSILAATVSK